MWIITSPFCNRNVSELFIAVCPLIRVYFGHFHVNESFKSPDYFFFCANWNGSENKKKFAKNGIYVFASCSETFNLISSICQRHILFVMWNLLALSPFSCSCAEPFCFFSFCIGQRLLNYLHNISFFIRAGWFKRFFFCSFSVWKNWPRDKM